MATKSVSFMGGDGAALSVAESNGFVCVEADGVDGEEVLLALDPFETDDLIKSLQEMRQKAMVQRNKK